MLELRFCMACNIFRACTACILVLQTLLRSLFVVHMQRFIPLSVPFLMLYGERWQSGHFHCRGKTALRGMREDRCTKRTLYFNHEHPGTAPLTRKLI